MGLLTAEAADKWLKHAKLAFSTGMGVESAGLRPFTGSSIGLDLSLDIGVNLEVRHVARTRGAALPGLQWLAGPALIDLLDRFM